MADLNYCTGVFVHISYISTYSVYSMCCMDFFPHNVHMMFMYMLALGVRLLLSADFVPIDIKAYAFNYMPVPHYLVVIMPAYFQMLYS